LRKEATPNRVGAEIVTTNALRPRPNMEFSRQVTIAPHNGIPTLSLQLGNRRNGTIFPAEACLTVIRRHQTLEDHVMWART
jgi:hypothetical protein